MNQHLRQIPWGKNPPHRPAKAGAYWVRGRERGRTWIALVEVRDDVADGLICNLGLENTEGDEELSWIVVEEDLRDDLDPDLEWCGPLLPPTGDP